MPDVNDIKAGKYELLDLYWDEPTSEPQDRVFTFVRHYQGEEVELDEANARRMVEAGSAVKAGERQELAARAELDRVRALLASVPDEVRARFRDELKAEVFAEREADVDKSELTVHTASGLVPEGSPRYASASSGEGDGGSDPQKPGKVKEGGAVGQNPGDGRLDLGPAAGVADRAQVSEDDGTKTGRNARKS